MALKVLVTAGDFEGSDGIVLHVDLESGRAEEWGRWRAPASLAVQGKGLAGGVIHGEHLYSATHAAVLRWDLNTATVDGVLHQPDFNDLHHVAVIDSSLFVVNTGSDAVERFSLDGKFIARWSFLPSWVQARRLHGEGPESFEDVRAAGWSGTGPSWSARGHDDAYYTPPDRRGELPFHLQKVADRVHPNHVAAIGGESVVTCLYDGTLRALGSLEALARLDGHPHDGQVDGNELWVTTIDGRVWALPLPIGSGPPVERANLLRLGRVGWCRGLLVREDVLVVGLSEVRADRLPRYRWADADPGDSVTAIVVLDRADGRELACVDLTDRQRHLKTYSILEAS